MLEVVTIIYLSVLTARVIVVILVLLVKRVRKEQRLVQCVHIHGTLRVTCYYRERKETEVLLVLRELLVCR